MADNLIESIRRILREKRQDLESDVLRKYEQHHGTEKELAIGADLKKRATLIYPEDAARIFGKEAPAPQTSAPPEQGTEHED